LLILFVLGVAAVLVRIIFLVKNMRDLSLIWTDVAFGLIVKGSDTESYRRILNDSRGKRLIIKFKG